jgi:hypothetical protein
MSHDGIRSRVVSPCRIASLTRCVRGTCSVKMYLIYATATFFDLHQNKCTHLETRSPGRRRPAACWLCTRPSLCMLVCLHLGGASRVASGGVLAPWGRGHTYVCRCVPSPRLPLSHRLTYVLHLCHPRGDVLPEMTLSVFRFKSLFFSFAILRHKRVVLVPCCPDLSACKSSEPVRVIVRTGTVFQFDML